MKTTKYLLIGGGLASGQAAKKIRERDPVGAITIVGDEPYVPYDRPPLSKEFLRGEKPKEALFFDPPDFFRERNIDLVLGNPVRILRQEHKTVELASGDAISFEKALIATGGRPIRLRLPGADLPGVFYLRTVDDSAGIAAEAKAGKRVVIIGAGFIGLEVAATLAQRGVHVTVVETMAHIWARFADAAIAGFFQSYCAEKGIVFRTGEQVTEIRGTGRASAAVTKSGAELPCDFVCIGVGIVPNVELARDAGLAVDNGIVVNEFLQTSDPDIYAAGDVASYVDPIFQKRRRVEHWGHAEYTGQLAGQNMAGGHDAYDMITYVWSDIFDLHLEFAGDESERERVLMRGSFQDRSFTVLYLKQNALTAYFSVNGNAKDFQPMQRLIRQKKDLSSTIAELQDPSFAIKGLL